MTNTFRNLQDRVLEIETTIGSLLDPDPTQHTDAKSQDLIKALILLCHAEFEEYFEQIAKQSIVKLIDELDTIKIKEISLLSIKNQYEALNKVIDTNNGIKLDNLKKFLPLLGFNTTTIDSDTYTTKLNSFAVKRGRIAHRGQTGIVTLLSFSQEKNELDWLVKETEDKIDSFFEREYGV